VAIPAPKRNNENKERQSDTAEIVPQAVWKLTQIVKVLSEFSGSLRLRESETTNDKIHSVLTMP